MMTTLTGGKSSGNIFDQFCVQFDIWQVTFRVSPYKTVEDTQPWHQTRAACPNLKVAFLLLFKPTNTKVDPPVLQMFLPVSSHSPFFSNLWLFFKIKFWTQMTCSRLPLCLLLVLALDLLPCADACFTCNTSGRKKREAASGDDTIQFPFDMALTNHIKASWCLAPPWSRRRRSPSPPATPTRSRVSPGRRWSNVRFV